MFIEICCAFLPDLFTFPLLSFNQMCLCHTTKYCTALKAYFSKQTELSNIMKFEINKLLRYVLANYATI